MNQSNSNTNTKSDSSFRPLTAKQSRELTPAEMSKVGGGWPSGNIEADRQLVR